MTERFKTGGFFFRRLAAVVVFAAGLVASAVMTWRVAQVYPVSSDDATGVLEADAILRGNVLLHGWTLSNVAFVVTDLPFYVAGVALKGMESSLLRGVPVAIYLTTLVVAVLLAVGRGRGRRGVLAGATVYVLLGLPAGALAELVTKGYIRVGTTLWFLGALRALDSPPGERVSAKRIWAFAVMLTLTVLSDTYALVVVGLAVLFVCGLGGLRGNPYKTISLWAVAAAVPGSAVAAQMLTLAINALDGYRVVHTSVLDFLASRDTARVMVANAVDLAANLPALYRCGLFTEITGPAVMIWMACQAGPFLLIWALVRGVPTTLTGRRVEHGESPDFVADILWVAVVLSPAAYVGSGVPKNPGTMRYMIPFVLAGAVLTGRVLTQRLRDLRPLVAILVILGLAYGLTVRDDLLKAPTDDTAERLAVFLDRLGLRRGYGSFWDASVVTAFGQNRVTVRPVWIRPISPERHSVEPVKWMTDRQWYEEGPVTFLVFEPEPATHFQFGVTEWHASTTFGTPSARYVLRPYMVMVWDHDLRPFLDAD